jgi:hypothetical protein
MSFFNNTIIPIYSYVIFAFFLAYLSNEPIKLLEYNHSYLRLYMTIFSLKTKDKRKGIKKPFFRFIKTIPIIA